MASDFESMLQAADAACNAVMGERTRVMPMVGGGYVAGQTDGNRANIEPVGIVDDVVAHAPVKGDRSSDSDRANISAPKSRVSYLESDLIWTPRKGDIVVLIDRTPQNQFRVIDALPDGLGRVYVMMIRI